MLNQLLLRLGLRFEDPTEERRFVDRFVRGNIGWTQIAMLLGAFTYAGYTLWDYVLYPEIVPTTLMIRGGIAVFVLLPLTALLSTPLKRWTETIYLLYCVIPGCVLTTLYLVIPSGFTHAAAGMIIVILFVSTMLPLRIGALAVFCVATWIALAISESCAQSMPEGLQFITHFEVGNAYALALFAVGAREYQARKQFRTAEALRREKERSEASLIELRETQAHLVQAEKLASLGQLVAGVAHQVSTPLGLALTASSAIQSETRSLSDVLRGTQVRRSDLTKGLERIDEGLRLTSENLHRAAELIDSFKQVATDQANEERQTFTLEPWLDALAVKLRPLLSHQDLTIHVECPPDIVLDTYPGALAQVIGILAFNAAVHAYPDDETGAFTVTASRRGRSLIEIVCADSGVGIPAELRDEVFDPFFTTRRDKGSAGLGLHIAFNVVTSTLGGRIRIQSAAESGTSVIVELPSQ